MIEQSPGDLVLWGWVLLISGTLALAFFVYRLVWLERYRRPTSSEPLVRVRGQVVGAPGTVVYCVRDGGDPIIAQPFHLRDAQNRRWLVQPSGAVLSIRGFRHRGGRVIRGLIAGEMVTVDGVSATVSNGEQLYRQAGRTPAIEAVRIAGGTWPELRWLKVPIVVAMAMFLLSLGQILHSPSSQTQGRQLAEAWAQEPSCPGLHGARFRFSHRGTWQPTVDVEDQSYGLGRLIGDHTETIQLEEDHLIVAP
jgi:hypothetical protein